MNRVDAKPKNVRELLYGVSYTIDYFQREYKWGVEQIQELLDDLEAKFLSSYSDEHERTEVAKYARYFLGSIIVSQIDSQKSIIDGQQRLTSLTLLLIYLHRLQREQLQEEEAREDVRELVFSAKYGKRAFNIDVEDRRDVMEALFTETNNFDMIDQSDSARNIYEQYRNIERLFPDSLRGNALAYFTSWLKENVDLVEITAFSDEDAYQIFETMNDRGLSLGPSDMLKGYLLANAADSNTRNALNELWKRRISELNQIAKEEDSNFFKAWLRSKYADSIREREKGAENEDFEEINTYHKWVRDHEARLGLQLTADFEDFVRNRFCGFSEFYLQMRRAAETLTPHFEHVYYNAYNNFTLQYMLALAPLRLQDGPDVIKRKIRLVTAYIDIYLARRFLNHRTSRYSSILYGMFNLMKEIRDADLDRLLSLLKDKIRAMDQEGDTLDAARGYTLNKGNRHGTQYILARLTAYVDGQFGLATNFETYVSRNTKKPFEIAHITSGNYERHSLSSSSPEEFQEVRNQLGALILAHRGFDRKYDKEEKENPSDIFARDFAGQNVLASSVDEYFYKNNNANVEFVSKSGLPFKPTGFFPSREDIAARTELYKCICERVWEPSRLDSFAD